MHHRGGQPPAADPALPFFINGLRLACQLQYGWRSRQRAATWIGGRVNHENEIACTSAVGRQLCICSSACVLWCWCWRWSGVLLCSRATSAGASCDVCSAGAWSWLQLGRRVLLSSWPALVLACRLLG